MKACFSGFPSFHFSLAAEKRFSKRFTTPALKVRNAIIASDRPLTTSTLLSEALDQGEVSVSHTAFIVPFSKCRNFSAKKHSGLQFEPRWVEDTESACSIFSPVTSISSSRHPLSIDGHDNASQLVESRSVLRPIYGNFSYRMLAELWGPSWHLITLRVDTG